MKSTNSAESNFNFIRIDVEQVHGDYGEYEGTLQYREKNGIGSYLWFNGNFYNGYWKDDEMNGFGTLYYAKGGRLRGNFINGKLNGFGRCNYSNGDCYIGMWSNGEFNGKGLFYNKTGNRWVLGDFFNGELKIKTQDGQGIPNSISHLSCKYRNKNKFRK